MALVGDAFSDFGVGDAGVSNTIIGRGKTMASGSVLRLTSHSARACDEITPKPMRAKRLKSTPKVSGRRTLNKVSIGQAFRAQFLKDGGGNFLDGFGGRGQPTNA